jgi:tetratricopeptide (TPR) repeat protein
VILPGQCPGLLGSCYQSSGQVLRQWSGWSNEASLPRRLAYLRVAYAQGQRSIHNVYLRRGFDLLNEVDQQGLGDGDVEEALARFYWESNPERAGAYASQALERKTLSARSRMNALYILADVHLQARRYEAALPLLKQLTQLRHDAEDWRLVGMCLLIQGQKQEALKALLHSASINPFSAKVHAGLADAYRQLGDRKRAQEHHETAQLLSESEGRNH